MRKLVTGVPSSHASPVIKLVSRPSTVPASTAWTCGRGRPGDRPHPHASDPEAGRPGHVICSVQCLRCPARRLLPPGSAPAKLRFPGPPSQTGLVDVVRHDGARHYLVAEECGGTVTRARTCGGTWH